MIDLLIKYIEDKGYEVEVISGAIGIWKRVIPTCQSDPPEQKVGVWWAIPQVDLRPDMEEVLYWQANRWMDEIEQAIAGRMPCKMRVLLRMSLENGSI